MKPAAMLAWWRGLHGKELREASGQQLLRNWGLSPTAYEELNPANNHVSWEADLFQLSLKTNHARTPDPQKWWDNAYGSKPLHFTEMCYAALDS